PVGDGYLTPKLQAMEARHAVRQCQYLQSEGKQVIELSSSRSMGYADFFDRLRGYIQFHMEMKEWLQTHCGHDELIMERVLKLPDIVFEDHSFRPDSLKTWLRVIVGAFIGPLERYLNREANQYVEKTVDQIHQNNTLYGSLAVLIRNMPQVSP
ncbi:MAG: hypothetical protein AAFV07_21240, partial [Bacteroidota bacterium]